MRRLISFLIGTLTLVPSFAFAASLPAEGPIDRALTQVDTAFALSQRIVRQSDVSEDQKSSVSNVLKTKHDTVKNSINNIR